MIPMKRQLNKLRRQEQMIASAFCIDIKRICMVGSFCRKEQEHVNLLAPVVLKLAQLFLPIFLFWGKWKDSGYNFHEQSRKTLKPFRFQGCKVATDCKIKAFMVQ